MELPRDVSQGFLVGTIRASQNGAEQHQLGPEETGAFILGTICQVDAGGEIQLPVQMTVPDMEAVCKHWAERLIDFACMLATGYWSSGNERELPHARLAHFSRILGEEKVMAVVDEVFEGLDLAGERALLEKFLGEHAEVDTQPADVAANESQPQISEG